MIKPHKAPDSSGMRNIAILIAVVAVLYLARELLIPLALAVTLALILTLDHLLALVEHLLHGRDAVLHYLGRISA